MNEREELSENRRKHIIEIIMSDTDIIDNYRTSKTERSD